MIHLRPTARLPITKVPRIQRIAARIDGCGERRVITDACWAAIAGLQIRDRVIVGEDRYHSGRTTNTVGVSDDQGEGQHGRRTRRDESGDAHIRRERYCWPT